MNPLGIDDRKQRVLQAIVRLYSTDGEPVGSTLLAQHFSMAVSSATLRNEMAMLTKLGLLEQPHTSAGRVPSAKGYRYYLDNLLGGGESLPLAQKRAIADLFHEMDYDPDRLAEGAARALAQRTDYAVIATTPGSDDMCIAHYEVVQVGRCTAAVLAVTNAGGVRTRTAKLDFTLKPEHPEKLAEALNRHLTFRRAQDVDEAVLHAVSERVGPAGTVLYPAISAAYTLLREAGRPRMFVEGQQNLLRYRDLEQSFHNLLALLADEQAVRTCLCANTQRTTVLLGEDVPDEPIPGFCVMSKQYLAGGGRTGSIGVIGPARMAFAQVMPQLEYFAQLLGEGMSGKKEEEKLK